MRSEGGAPQPRLPRRQHQAPDRADLARAPQISPDLPVPRRRHPTEQISLAAVAALRQLSRAYFSEGGGSTGGGSRAAGSGQGAGGGGEDAGGGGAAGGGEAGQAPLDLVARYAIPLGKDPSAGLRRGELVGMRGDAATSVLLGPERGAAARACACPWRLALPPAARLPPCRRRGARPGPLGRRRSCNSLFTIHRAPLVIRRCRRRGRRRWRSCATPRRAATRSLLWWGDLSPAA